MLIATNKNVLVFTAKEREMSKNYFWVRPERANWQPTIEQCRRQALRFLLEPKKIGTLEGTMYQQFKNVSDTYWRQFWKEVTSIPLERIQ